MTAATTVGLWVVIGLAGYAALAYALLFYLPPADRLSNGPVVDGVFVATVPFVLAVTWIAAVRR